MALKTFQLVPVRLRCWEYLSVGPRLRKLHEWLPIPRSGPLPAPACGQWQGRALRPFHPIGLTEESRISVEAPVRSVPTTPDVICLRDMKKTSSEQTTSFFFQTEELMECVAQSPASLPICGQLEHTRFCDWVLWHIPWIARLPPM
ncbi:hypothetical protein AVEN_160930-1 [Araneus ventricosus]|uniref:Uncharacterized protein n=1 Tax=Araneus ventricosus TaxID=182803 RepID=A0A4Y2BE52_ARAVE|nr:hypothetical protein AVEN_160930-1 [Araneus ventricosus]